MAADSGNAPVMMVLGGYLFSLNTIVFQEWARSTNWKWPGQERFGQNDALQFTGEGDDTLQLPGVLYPNWRGDIGSLDDLRDMAGAGVPYLLVDSMGNVRGRWVIEKLDEKQTLHDVDGTPRKIEFALSLKKYDDGETANDGSAILASASSAADAASAVSSTTSSALSGFAGMVKTVQSSAATAMGQLKSAVSQVTAVVAPVVADAASAIGALNRSIDVVSDLRATAANVAQQVQSIGTIGGVLSGSNTIMDKVRALGIQGASATRVIDNIGLVSGSVSSQVGSVLNTASNATTGVSTLLADTSSAAEALKNKFS